MFKIDDYVIYNSNGVYKIIDIRKENISGNDINYYVLEPVFSENMIIKIPVSNTKVVMRKIMTKDEVLELIAAMPDQESIWINDDRERKEYFKAALKTAESEEWMKLIKTIYLKKQEKIDHGKKIAKTDEDIMRAAEKNLYEEFAVVLNITPEEVLSYINERISS